PRLNRARQGSQRLSRVMQALLTMFRSGTEPQWQAVPLSVLLAPWPHDGLAIVSEGDPTLHADPDLLAAVLMNLLDNARQHGATQVQLRASSSPDGQQTLHLHDNGPGCPDATLQRLRQALQQHDYTPGTGLSGLGLMLADLVLQAHGGSVALPNVNTGFAVLLQWPQPPEKSA
ncbi:MAG: HAMP domain-containing sensor histidine kinase, partial [Macromonas bipunctata]|nr:HAMP domain-containing sensor histidine kinase [Macromonas bipunctata]